MKDYLLRRPEQFVTATTEKLLMYAIGRNVQYFDAPSVRTIVRNASQENFTFASLVQGIVSSVPFQMRQAQDEPR